MQHLSYDCVTKLQRTQPLFVSLTWKQQRQKEFQRTQIDHNKTSLILNPNTKLKNKKQGHNKCKIEVEHDLIITKCMKTWKEQGCGASLYLELM